MEKPAGIRLEHEAGQVGRLERGVKAGRYDAPNAAVSPDYATRSIALGVLNQLDERVPPQLLVDAIAAIPLGSALDSRRSDALAALSEIDRRSFQLPSLGIWFLCEACGGPDVIQGRRRHWAASIPWAQLETQRIDDFEDVLIPLLDCPWAEQSTAAEISLYRRLRFEQPDGPVSRGGRQLIYRLTLVCKTCIRRHLEGNGLRRCWHEDAVAGDWRRCQRVAMTKDYCRVHASPAMKRARARSDEHRRARATIPSLMATRSDRGRLVVQHGLAVKDAAWFADRVKA